MVKRQQENKLNVVDMRMLRWTSIHTKQGSGMKAPEESYGSTHCRKNAVGSFLR